MSNPTIHDSYEYPVSPKRLKEIEAEFSISLPEDYTNFLLQHNGGYPTPEYFPIQNEHVYMSMVRDFFGVHSEPYTSLMSHLRWKLDRMPDAFVPIGNDPGGNMICIVVKGDNYGAVYFWDHEQEALAFGEEEPWLENLYFVASTFTEFLDLLQELKETDNQ